MQHVNLYQLQFQKRRDPLSARNLLLVLIAAECCRYRQRCDEAA